MKTSLPVFLALAALAFAGCASSKYCGRLVQTESGPVFRIDGFETTASKTEKDGTVFTCWDAGDRIAFRFDVTRDSTVAIVGEITEPLSLAYGDRVEIYFSPTEIRTNGYVCAEIDRLGRVLDYHVTTKNKYLWDWNFKTLETRASQNDTGYVVEGTVTKAELAEYGIDPKSFWVGVYRADCIEVRQLGAWCSAMPMGERPSFHRQGMFLPINF